MNKTKITNTISLHIFDENDYVANQKQIYDDLNKVLNSFDFDANLSFAREYLDNLNSDIYLNDKKFQIFELKINKTVVSFAICSGKKIDMIWTDFEFAKLGYATILLRLVAIEFFKQNKFEFCVEFDEKNLIAESLFESFGKIENVKILQKNEKNGKKTYKFDIKNIKIDEILKKLKEFAI